MRDEDYYKVIEKADRTVIVRGIPSVENCRVFLKTILIARQQLNQNK